MKGASTTLCKPTYRPKHSKQSPSPGHLWSRGSIWLDLSKATGGYTHLLVTIDKFTKWIEARPISVIKSVQAVLFFLNIIHRFGVPNSIITNNGT